MVAPLLVQSLYLGDGGPEKFPVGAGDAVVAQRRLWIVSARYMFRDVAYERVECVRALDEAHGKHQLVVHLYGHLVLGEHVAGPVAQLQRVPQVDRHRHGGVAGVLDGRSRHEHVGGAREMDGDRVNVDARNRIAQLAEHL